MVRMDPLNFVLFLFLFFVLFCFVLFFFKEIRFSIDQ